MDKLTQRTILLLALAAASFIPTLWFYTVGEEGIYTISSMEMWHHNNWLVQTLYGLDLHRPPLMNWLIMPVASLLGWSHVLFATRAVSILATLGMTAWLYFLSRRLFNDKNFAKFAALACLSLADLLIYRGWLAYTDPTFAFFTFGSMACLWIATVERRHGWLLASVVMLSCALLSKAFTAYVFYGTAVFVLLWQQPQRRFLLSPASLLIFSLALIAPLAWFKSIPQVSGHSSSMLGEILLKLSAGSWLDYFSRLLTYPVETAIWLSPTTLVACYLLLRKRIHQIESAPLHFRAAVSIAALCILPYWLAPQGGIRYLLPVYPLIALIGARIIWRAGTPGQILALRWFAATITLKFLFSLALFPYYQSHFRGENYVIAAHDIMKQAAGYPLYAEDTRSITESIVSEIDLQRLPQSPLLAPPANWDNGFLLAMEPDNSSQIFRKIRVANDDLYLLCRGPACMAPQIMPTQNY